MEEANSNVPITGHSDVPIIGDLTILEILIAAVVLFPIVSVIVYFVFLRKRKNAAQIPAAVGLTEAMSPPAQTYGKRCPDCHSTYTDLSLKFCLADGATLEDSGDDEFETVVRSR